MSIIERVLTDILSATESLMSESYGQRAIVTLLTGDVSTFLGSSTNGVMLATISENATKSARIEDDHKVNTGSGQTQDTYSKQC